MVRNSIRIGINTQVRCIRRIKTLQVIVISRIQKAIVTLLLRDTHRFRLSVFAKGLPDRPAFCRPIPDSETEANRDRGKQTTARRYRGRSHHE